MTGGHESLNKVGEMDGENEGEYRSNEGRCLQAGARLILRCHWRALHLE